MLGERRLSKIRVLQSLLCRLREEREAEEERERGRVDERRKERGQTRRLAGSRERSRVRRFWPFGESLGNNSLREE
jgi:hypothetical protein